MKSKIVTLAVVALVLFSCGTKKQVAEAPVAPSGPAVGTVRIENAAPATDLAAGQSLYENKCASCHKLYDPKKFTKEEWGPILVSMGKKAHLDTAQMTAVSDYINSQL